MIAAIARNTFRETVRDKILYSILLFALGFALVAGIVSSWSMSQEEKIMQDFGLLIITVFSLVIAIFAGIGLVYKEIERRTIYSILSKPVTRGQYLLGKYSGLMLTVLVTVALMGIGLFVVIWIFTGVINVLLLLPVVMLFFTMAIIVAYALLFSTVTSPAISGILTLFIFIAGNFAADVRLIDYGSDSGFMRQLLDVLYYVLPNFELLNFKPEAVHGLPVDYAGAGLAILYSIAYSAIVLTVAIQIFNRTDMK